VPGAHGIFVLAPIGGEAGERIRALQAEYDPKLARESPPHVTLAGSAGLAPSLHDAQRERLLEEQPEIEAESAPLELPFQTPHRFMQTNIVVLPLDPHGALRRLHDRIAASGLPFARARFTFTPHATLSFYPTLAPERFRELLAMRFDEPAIIDRLTVYYTRDPQPAVKLVELPLNG
jgi:2'-5' RNA ligase